jgi:hypothetical protein
MPKEAHLSEDDILSHLNRVREEQGEDAYKTHVRALARNLVRTEQGKEWIQRHFPELDLDELVETSAQPAMGPKAMMDLLKTQIPGCRSQGQFDAILLLTEALQMALSAYCGTDAEAQSRAKERLLQTLDMLARASRLTQQLEDVPEAATSEAAQAFKEPPKQFAEQDLQRGLLTTLAEIKSASELNAWYADSATKEAISRIVTQTLRNELFDHIRNKRKELSN